MARKVAEDSVEDLGHAVFEITASELEERHAERVAASSDPPGLAETLIVEIGRRTSSQLHIDKVVLVEAMAAYLADELSDADPDQVQGIKERRPIVAFMLDRVIATLNRPRPAGSAP